MQFVTAFLQSPVPKRLFLDGKPPQLLHENIMLYVLFQRQGQIRQSLDLNKYHEEIGFHKKNSFEFV